MDKELPRDWILMPEEELVRPMSAQEIMAEAGVPNLLEGRKIRLNVFGSMAETGRRLGRKPSLERLQAVRKTESRFDSDK